MNADIFFGYGSNNFVENTDMNWLDFEALSVADLETLEYLSRFWLGVASKLAHEFQLQHGDYIMTLPNQQWAMDIFESPHVTPKMVVQLGVILCKTNVYKCISLTRPGHNVLLLTATWPNQ